MSHRDIKKIQKRPIDASEDDCNDSSEDDSPQTVQRRVTRNTAHQTDGDTMESRKEEVVEQLASVAISGSSVKTGPGKNPEQLTESE